MASPMASTCNRYAAGCTKEQAKILRPKNSEKEKNAPGKARKRRNRVRFGCWGGGNGWKQIKPGTKTSSLNQNESHSHTIRAKRKPARIQCFRRFCGRGRRTCLACRLGCCSPVGSAQHRPKRESRPALDAAHRAAGPHDTHRRRACGRTLLPRRSAQ